LKNHLPNDTVNQVLTDGLNESALYLELNINEALNAETERKAVEALRHAYQKTGSVRYYIELLKETKAIPEFVADDLLADCETIRQALEPIMEEYRGEYDDMPDDEFYDWLNQVFGDEEGQDDDFDL
jgi:four helix bundle protein